MRKFFYCMFILLTAGVLPVSAFAAQLPPDGQYTINVTLSGGSGRTEVESPAKMTITDGTMTAVIVWSSPNYDFMMVDGINYYPINTDGNSAFEIPVSVLDEDIAVSAETVAMSEPHVIDYILHFDSASLTSLADNGGAEPATWEKILISGSAIAVIGIAVWLITVLRRREKQRNTSE